MMRIVDLRDPLRCGDIEGEIFPTWRGTYSRYHQRLGSGPSASNPRVRARDLCIPLETRRFLSSADRFQGVQEWFGERTQRSGRVGRKIPITSSGVTLSITNMISRHVCMYMSHFPLRFGECPPSHLLCLFVSLSRSHSRGDCRQGCRELRRDSQTIPSPHFLLARAVQLKHQQPPGPASGSRC
jgi:hypothetical protein